MRLKNLRQSVGRIHAMVDGWKSCLLTPILPDKSERRNMGHLFNDGNGKEVSGANAVTV